MFELFQIVGPYDETHRHAQRTPPEFQYVKNIYLRELQTLQDYYHSRVYAVKNQNLLVRLLRHVDTPMQYGASQFVEVTRTRGPFIGKAFRLTSALDYGDIHPGAFFGPGTDEIIFYDDSYFDPIYAEKNWQRISAVKPVMHPRSDMGLMLPNGKASSTDTGIASIVINLPLLALQLRSFFKDQLYHQQMEHKGMLDITHFVHMYVLPNMMYHHTDITMMNRLMRIFYNQPFGESLFKHPIRFVNYDTKLNHICEKVLDHIYNRTMLYDDMLRMIPAIYHNNMKEALIMPKIAPTRQSWWAMMVSRIEIMKFLIDLGGDRCINTNRSHINHMQRDLRKLKRENVFDRFFSYEESKLVQYYIDELMSI